MIVNFNDPMKIVAALGVRTFGTIGEKILHNVWLYYCFGNTYKSFNVESQSSTKKFFGEDEGYFNVWKG